MTKKLTLSIPEELIERSKNYASQQGRSLSELVANYLRQLTEEYEQGISPLVEEMTGAASLEDNRNYKEIYAEALGKKYG